jgi:hypothetical protein
MKIKITSEAGWMGSPKGTIVEVTPLQAREMVARGQAKVVKMTSAPKDKMVRAAKNK